MIISLTNQSRRVIPIRVDEFARLSAYMQTNVIRQSDIIHISDTVILGEKNGRSR